MAQQRDLFSALLRTANYTKAFVSQRKNNEEKLRLRLEQAEASLSAAREDNEALRIELAEAKSQEESTDARLHEAEDEMTQLRGEVRHNSGQRCLLRKSRERICSCVYQRKKKSWRLSLLRKGRKLKRLLEASRRNVFLRLPLLYEETWYQAGCPFDSPG
ncbi:hypothetical protein CK203_066533 [Vitis vinifera]|uniref:Uncharacterized protein n=1 Tax=Vitis vinifera TaxID=29760 RepID=A0A438G2J6_VITVI|nr:hypothetical protein CK203_066533 [Vitis vinifera]